MQVKDFVSLFRTLQDTPWASDFMNAEVYPNHDEMFIWFDTPVLFSDKELASLEELGLIVDSTVDTNNEVRSFVMYF